MADPRGSMNKGGAFRVPPPPPPLGGNPGSGVLRDIVAGGIRELADALTQSVGQKERVADAIQARRYGAVELAADTLELGARGVRVWTNLGSRWAEIIDLVVLDLRRQGGPDAAMDRSAASGAGAGGGGAGPRRIAVEIVGNKHARGEALLGGGADLAGAGGRFVVAPLRPEAGDAPPIADARLGATDETGAVAVIVNVPADQPPGAYSGVISDGGGRLLGSILVMVAPGEAAS